LVALVLSDAGATRGACANVLDAIDVTTMAAMVRSLVFMAPSSYTPRARTWRDISIDLLAVLGRRTTGLPTSPGVCQISGVYGHGCDEATACRSVGSNGNDFELP